MALSAEAQQWQLELKLEKKILKTKITKARNGLLHAIQPDTVLFNVEDVEHDFKEYNQYHRSILEIFHNLETLAANDDELLEKLIDEEKLMKQTYRNTKREVEKFLKSNAMVVDISLSSVFSNSIIQEVHSTETCADTKQVDLTSTRISPTSPPFRGFPNTLENISDKGTRDEESHKVGLPSNRFTTLYNVPEESTLYKTAINSKFSWPSDKSSPADNHKEVPSLQPEQRTSITGTIPKSTFYTNQTLKPTDQYSQSQKSAFTLIQQQPKFLIDQYSQFQKPTSEFFDNYQKTDAAQDFKLDFKSNREENPINVKITQNDQQSTHQVPFNYTYQHPYQLPVAPIKLQPLTLTQFDGSYDKWESFRDMYEAMIHNTPMSTIEKFQRLRQLLIGPAASFIANIQISEANYVIVWDDIKQYYNNPRRIVATHIQRLIDLKPLNSTNAQGLRSVLDKFKSHVRALKSAKQDHNSDILQLHILLSKLDKQSRQKWESKMSTETDIPKLQDLYNMLEKRIRSLEVNPIVTTDSSSSIRRNSKPEIKTQVSYHSTIKNSSLCKICHCAHSIYKCDVFKQAQPQERLRLIDAKNLCRNCLQHGHEVSNCNSGSCRVKDCTQKHHTMLHYALTMKEQGTSLTTTLVSKCKDTLLATGIAIINDKNGCPHKIRVLFDSGSQCNFMTNSLCQKLKLEPQSDPMEISGIGKSTNEVVQSVQVTLKSHTSTYSVNIICSLMENITEALPQRKINITNWKIPTSIKLADPDFYKPATVDMLLSASVFFDSLTDGIFNLGDSKPKLFNSLFGWLVAGGNINKSVIPSPVSCHAISQKSLQQLIEGFWSVEAFPEFERIRSIEDEICETHFVDNYRTSNGKFVVKLPFKFDHTHLSGNNRKRAEACWLSTERKFVKDDNLKSLYTDFMLTYLKMGHMKEASPTDEIKYFIPHHHVWKKGVSEKKFRVVFNASSKTYSNKSLNDLLYIGPSIQDELINILIRFREHEITLVGDIEKMYRQVLVEESDQLYQGIVWRENCSEPLKSYKLTTLTYGTAPAAFLATRCIKQACELDGKDYPLAAKVAVRDFYMDDLLTGATSVSEAIKLRQQIQKMLQQNGFPICKWISNSDTVLKSIPEDLCEINPNVDLSLNKTIKTLGMHWTPLNDQFQFFTTEFQSSLSKRTVLSDIAKLFDPLGLVNPVIYEAKCFIQLMWKQDLDWDDELPKTLHDQWLTFKQSMQNLVNIKVDRKIFNTPNFVSLQLFGFCDASEKGYGACIYAVNTYSNGTLSSNLICSKSRVAPLKTQSIPRLELCAALLLSELITSVQQAMLNQPSSIYCFTDSNIVLAWLSKSPTCWKIYTANRVAKIQTLVPSRNWYHINSIDNPADILSRGCTPEKLIDNCLWWHGPIEIINDHLFKTIEACQLNLNQSDQLVIQGEQRVKVHLALTSNHSFIEQLYQKHSKLTFIIRIVAYIHRFINNCKIKNIDCRQNGNIKYEELIAAQHTLARYAQKKHFPVEFHAINAGKELPKNSKILSLNPIWDKKLELLRVGGRISNSNLPEPRKHQIILPQDNIFTKRLFEMEHLHLLHAGPALLLNHLRHIWWPINGKRIATSTLHNCITCFKRNPKKTTQIMADLPKCRVTPTKPFMSTALDFAGPVKVKQNEGPRCKNVRDSWICVFVCCSTKAIYLDLVSSYTADAFIACLRRFVARKGKVRNIYCDNGTNFVGANNILRKLMKTEPITEQLNHEFSYIDFHFSPARSPHTGGLYEANVRSMKAHLNRMMGKEVLNFEQLQTLLCQIEACLNSRPICILPTGPEEIAVLTPGHFLTGDALMTLPDVNYTDVNPNRLDKWCRIQQMTQQYWKVWSSEYFNSLQHRYKWKQHMENLKEGDVVIVRDEDHKPLHWKLGRVEKVYPDKYGHVRTVQVLINKHLTNRSVHRLCKLPINDDYLSQSSDSQFEITM